MKIAELWVVLDTKLEAFNKGMSDAERSMVKVGKRFEAVGKKLTMMVTLPILAVGAAAVKMGADFEQSMMNAASVSGATGEELKRMEGIARDMGETTVFSARQAADAMYFMASAGWKVGDMGVAIKPILDLAAATQSDLAFATDTVVASLNQFQLGSQGAERVTNVFAAAIGNSQATMEKLSISMRYVGPLFNSMGKEVEEAAATLMVLYNAGYDASMAGTALRMGMVKLMDGTKKTTDALARLNLTLKDVDPTTMHFADIIEILGKRGAKTKDIIDIFGVRAGPAFAALITQGGDAIRNFEKGITGTDAAARMAEMQINTLKGSFKLLTSALTEAAIQIFKILGPSIKDLVDNKLKPAVLWFNSLSESTKKTIVQVAGLAAAAGPLLLIFGKLLTILPKLKLAMAALTGPFGIISGALIGLAVGAKRAKDGFVDMDKAIKDMEQISGKRMSGFEKLWWKVSNAISKVTTGIDDAKIVQAKYNEELAKAHEKFKNVPNILNLGEKAVDGVSSALGKGWEWLKNYGKQTENVTENTKAFEKAQRTLIEALEFTLTPEMELARAYAEGSISLLEYTSKMRELREERAKMSDDLADLELAEGEVQLAFEETDLSVITLAEDLGLLPPAFNDAKEEGKKAADEIESSWSKALLTLAPLINILGDEIGGAFGNVVSNISLAFDQIAGSADKSFKGIMKAIGPVLAGEIGGAIGQMVSGATKSFASLGSAIGGAVALIPGIGTALAPVFSAVGGFIGGLFKKGKDEAQKAAEALAKHVSDIIKAMSKYGEISEATAKKIQEADKTMEGFAAVSKYFGDIIKDVGVTQENVNDLWDRAVGIIENWHQGHLTAAEAAKAAGESFTLLLDGARKLGQEGSEAMINFILKTRELGLEVPEVTEYVISQLDRIPSALETLITAQEKTGQSIESLELRTLAAFSAMEASGMNWTDIVHNMSPALNALRDRMEATGYTGSEAIQKLLKIAEVTEANKELFDAIEADRTIMEAFGNTGFMTGEILNGFAKDAIGNYEELKIKFGNSDDALRAMGPTLQKIRDYADAYNITLDEGTQNLIDQATEIGAVKKAQEDNVATQERLFDKLGGRMKEIMDDVGDRIVGALSDGFDRAFGNAEGRAGEAAGNISDTIGTIQPIVNIGFDYDVPDFDFSGKVNLDFDYDEPDFGGGGGGKGGGGFQHEGIAWRPQLARVAEKGPEVIANIQQLQAGTSKFSGMFAAPPKGASQQEIHNYFTFKINALDGADVERVVTGKIMPILKRAYRDNIGGSAQDLSKQMEKY